MRKQIFKIGLFGLLLSSLGIQGQERQERKADQKVENYAYLDAIKIYERIAKKGYESPDLFKNIGDSYYFNGSLLEANYWYAKLFELDLEIPSEYYYRYSQTLKAKADYKLSDYVLDKFKKKEVNDERGRLFDNNRNYLEEIYDNSGRYTVNLLDVSGVYSDYGSVVFNNQLIFTSARDTGSFSKKVHTWTGESFTSLYKSDINEDGSLGNIKRFAKEIRSKFNESTPTFSADGQTMYFTRNNFYNGKKGKDSNHVTLLKIYKASLVNDRWTNVEELPFNSDQYSTAHPALSADGKWLYFVSDREGGYGQSDLYKVSVNQNRSYGEPINLGESINTEGRESFPFITADNELYFSTDGRPGLGGLDIFATKINEDGSFTNVQNIGAPINSTMDDFAYYIDGVTRKGYFSSNRINGMGKDDIYGFSETKQIHLECKQGVFGKVYDSHTKEPLTNVNLILYDGYFNQIKTVKTSIDGSYSFEGLKCNTRYRVNSSMFDFNTAEVTVDLPNRTGNTQVDFGLERTRVIIEKGDDLFKVLKLNPIYFDYDKSEIRLDAARELLKIVEVLREHPNMKIDVRSHTDSRGNDEYNLKLSARRAKSTVAWIVSHGISKNRVKGEGYGETRLINHCSNGVKCSEEEHQQNRRSEFIVLEIDNQ